MINKQLAKSGVPKVPVKMRNMAGGAYGNFQMSNWQMKLNSNMINGPLSPGTASELAKTVYHEARHAEQWFNAARTVAGGATGNPMGLPAAVGRAAARAPLAAGSNPQAMMGQMTHQSAYGVGAQNRNDTLNAHNANPTPATDAKYRALGEEEDAWGVDDNVN